MKSKQIEINYDYLLLKLIDQQILDQRNELFSHQDLF